MCWSEPYTREVFAQSPKLKCVLRSGVGVDTVDLDGATEFGVMVGHFPDFCIPEVANHALALMLDCAKKVSRFDRIIRRDGWNAHATGALAHGPHPRRDAGPGGVRPHRAGHGQARPCARHARDRG